MTVDLNLFSSLLEQALQRRMPFLEGLHNEGTDCYRLFHGAAEGIPGLTLDRYGPLLLLQTFREPLSPSELNMLENTLHEKISHEFVFGYNHRGKKPTQSFDEWHKPAASALAELQCREMGVQFHIRLRHQGIDPWLFLDLRAGRRFLRSVAKDLSVLNLFSYTCSAGVCAVAAGASEAWNVDFASSSLDVGRANTLLNHLRPERIHFIEEDCLPVMRQLAGLSAGGRFAKAKKVQRFEPRQFDLVFLDPPAWSRSSFGAVDVARDYPTLFKPALLSTKPGGGRIIATNHVAAVDIEAWTEQLKRCAEKAGRPLRSIQKIAPEADFPSFDGRHPLKILVCEA